MAIGSASRCSCILISVDHKHNLLMQLVIQYLKLVAGLAGNISHSDPTLALSTMDSAPPELWAWLLTKLLLCTKLLVWPAASMTPPVSLPKLFQKLLPLTRNVACCRTDTAAPMLAEQLLILLSTIITCNTITQHDHQVWL